MDKVTWGLESATGSYHTIEYVVADGPPDDPGSTIFRRLAVFRDGEQPEDFQAAFQAVLNSRSSYYSYEGLEGALMDEYVETVQEGDTEANEHRRAHERMSDQDGYVPYNWRTASGGVSYEQFLTAIDTVANDGENEEAWTTIDLWRQRQLRHDERG